MQLLTCSAYPGPQSVLVMDNARIHHDDAILELVNGFGICIEYLPPYSPDLNPIEEAFSTIKYFLQCHQCYYLVTEGGDRILWDAFEVLEIIMPEVAEGYFMHSGYM